MVPRVLLAFLLLLSFLATVPAAAALATDIGLDLGVVPVAAQQTPPAPWQYEPEEPPTQEPWQYEPAQDPTPPPRFEYEPQPTPTPRPIWTYDPEETPTPPPYTPPATSVAWMNPTTGDIYVGVEIPTASSIESSALANDLDAEALREIGFVVYREVYDLPESPLGWQDRADVDAVYSASIEGADGYVVVLSNGPRVCIIVVANIYGDELDVEAATDYMEGVARFGTRHRPSGGFVETPYD